MDSPLSFGKPSRMGSGENTRQRCLYSSWQVTRPPPKPEGQRSSSYSQVSISFSANRSWAKETRSRNSSLMNGMFMPVRLWIWAPPMPIWRRSSVCSSICLFVTLQFQAQNGVPRYSLDGFRNSASSSVFSSFLGYNISLPSCLSSRSALSGAPVSDMSPQSPGKAMGQPDAGPRQISPERLRLRSRGIRQSCPQVRPRLLSWDKAVTPQNSIRSIYSSAKYGLDDSSTSFASLA